MNLFGNLGGPATPGSTAPSTTATPQFGFGAKPPGSASSGFAGFGPTSSAAGAPTSTASGIFGTSAFSMGAPASTAAPAAKGLGAPQTAFTGFGATPASSGNLLGQKGAAPATDGTAPPPAYGVQTSAPPATSATPAFSLSALGSASKGFSLATPASQPASQGLTLGSSASTGAVSKASSAGLQLGGSASVPATGFSLNPTSSAASAASSLGALAAKPAATSAAAPSISAAATSVTVSSTGPKMTYKELEDQMNKWTVELEHQENVFLEQATKVNAWDKILIENGQKITDLNSDVEKVKLDQHRLNHELDFIVAQQKELEEMLVPLEDSVAKLPSINYQQHTDTEREHTYQIAENIDAQLKRMTEDLKEVIDHLNTGSGSQDSSDPMLQISKILNAHMESLQWVDQNAAILQRKTEEIARYADYTKKEHERNFRLAYN